MADDHPQGRASSISDRDMNPQEEAIFTQMMQEENDASGGDTALPSPPDGEPLHAENRQLTTPENDAVNADVQRLVDALIEGRILEAIQSPNLGPQELFAGRRAHRTLQEELNAVGENPTPWPQPFRWAGPRFTYHQRRPSSWETIDESSEDPSRDDGVPKNRVSKEKQRLTPFIQPALRINKDKEAQPQPRTPSPTAFRARDSTVVRSTPEEVIATFEDEAILFDLHKPQGPSTPSIHSTGSEFDESSPSFLKSVQAVVEGTPRRKDARSKPASAGLAVTGSGQLVEDTAVEVWLQGVADEPERVVNEPETITREPKPPAPPPLIARRRAFAVLQEDPGSSTPRKPSKVPVPASKALKDISNLRRPGPRANPSIAKETKLASKGLDDICNLRRPGYLAQNSFAKSQQTATSAKRAGLGPDHTGLGLALPPGDVGFARPTPPSKLPRRTTRNPKDLKAVPAEEQVTSLFSFEPSAERRAHFGFALARLEGRAPPRTPSPVHRFANPPGWFGDHVEIEQKPRPTHRPAPVRDPVRATAVDEVAMLMEEAELDAEIERLVLEEMMEARNR